MEAGGDDLTRPRDIDFSVVFPNENSANEFANHFRVRGLAASVELTGTVEDFPWDVTVVKQMVPSHEEIGAFENSLQQVADSLGGHNDGWGCFRVPKC